MSIKNGLTREELINIQDTIRKNNLHKNELNFKIVVIGDFGVDEFSTEYKITIGADFAIKRLEWDENTRINLHVWDIAGHERFGSLLSVFYRHAVAAAIVFDLTRPETFKSIDKWLSDLRRKIYLPGGKSIPVVILANKGDITTKTIPDHIKEYCEANGILYWYITSAKQNINIDEAMLKLTKAALTNYYGTQCSLITEDIVTLKDEPKDNTPRSSCC
ncbi:ras-related protein Rab-32 isoform X2 [Leptinotarsa decemlineata]|uniref:ras-related protein Rab-32 isoform X2 n=1 Tax=Leptinotarsa decemlineata TaxID=7539 RepID=UPI003D30534F